VCPSLRLSRLPPNEAQGFVGDAERGSENGASLPRPQDPLSVALARALELSLDESCRIEKASS
jgi:hypothetical protein